MKKTFSPLIPLLLFVLSSASGCYNDNAELLYGSQNINCNTVQAKFGTDISQLINTKCAISGCHDTNGPGNPPGFSLQTYAQVSAKKDRINTRVVVEKTMPPAGPLTPEEISKIKCWIAGGALNN